MFANSFTLTLSGSAEFSHLDDDRDAWVSITASTVTATVGLGDQGGDRIPFELSEGGPLRGRIATGEGGLDHIVGRLEAELETRGVYTLEGWGASTRDGVTYTAGGQVIPPRKLKITVVAIFGARRGSLSCGQ